VEAAVPRALEHGSPFFIDIEHQIGERGRTLLCWLAIQEENVAIKPTDFEHQRGQSDDWEETISRLSQRDLIEKVDGAYRFQVELIRRWFAP
jgi:hypothetical protein